jgi:hypothetical protein
MQSRLWTETGPKKFKGSDLNHRFFRPVFIRDTGTGAKEKLQN